MPQEFEDYYKRLRDNDYKLDPFNMKMLNKGFLKILKRKPS